MDRPADSRLAPLAGLAADELLVSEIFASLQGESTYAGARCAMVRLTGCNLRCRWCDTAYAFAGGEVMRVAAVVERVAALAVPLVEVTGGEPLAQPAALALLRALCDAGHTVLLETSGSLPIGAVDPRVIKIVDFKAPSSGETEANDWGNVAALAAHDQVKLVLADRRDFDWAARLIAEERLAERCVVLLSPVWGELEPRTLAEWLLAERLPARLGVQLHKLLWGPSRRGV